MWRWILFAVIWAAQMVVVWFGLSLKAVMGPVPASDIILSLIVTGAIAGTITLVVVGIKSLVFG